MRYRAGQIGMILAQKKRIMLLIDMNSYFASVEQQANRLLRGKPVGVCAYKSENGVIIASSIEAKARGVATATPVRVAKRLCPEIVLVQNDPSKYRHLTKQIFSILSDYSDLVEPYSIDEAFVDLTGFVGSLAEARSVGQEIQHRIKKEVGIWLKCKIGISTTRYLAKLAADHLDPDTVSVLQTQDLRQYLKKLRLTDLWGINTRLRARLHLLGIATPLELKDYPVENLLTVMGKPGFYLWANVNGVELNGLVEPQSPKSIGHSYCLYKQTADPGELGEVYMKLCEKAGRRLRSAKKEARTTFAYWGYVGGGGNGGAMRNPKPVWDTQDIYLSVLRLFNARFARAKVRMLGMGISDLIPRSGQLTFFHDTEADKRLADALDHVNDRYGEYTVYRGAMHGTKDRAPDRVGYRKSVAAEWVDRSGVSVATDPYQNEEEKGLDRK